MMMILRTVRMMDTDVMRLSERWSLTMITDVVVSSPLYIILTVLILTFQVLIT